MSPETVQLILGNGVMVAGVVGAVVAFRKVRPESDQIVVSAAKDVVVIQKGLVDDLRRQMDEQRRQLEDLEARFSERLDRAEQARRTAETALAECQRARQVIEKDYRAEKARNVELCERVEALEAEVAALKAVNRDRTPPEENP